MNIQTINATEVWEWIVTSLYWKLMTTEAGLLLKNHTQWQLTRGLWVYQAKLWQTCENQSPGPHELLTNHWSITWLVNSKNGLIGIYRLLMEYMYCRYWHYMLSDMRNWENWASPSGWHWLPQLLGSSILGLVMDLVILPAFWVGQLPGIILVQPALRVYFGFQPAFWE